MTENPSADNWSVWAPTTTLRWKALGVWDEAEVRIGDRVLQQLFERRRVVPQRVAGPGFDDREQEWVAAAWSWGAVSSYKLIDAHEEEWRDVELSATGTTLSLEPEEG